MPATETAATARKTAAAMTRDELVAAETDAMVAQWGEDERDPARRMAAGKTVTQLRYSQAVRILVAAGMAEGDAHAALAPRRPSARIARHCLDHGQS